MTDFFESIVQSIKDALIEGIRSNFSRMFTEVNTRVGEIAGQVGQTPSGWNRGIYDMVQNLSETVIIPIAGIILTFVLSYELIHMIIEKNNMVDFDTSNIFKWIFKCFVAAYIVTNTFDIVMAIFALAQNVVADSASLIGGSVDVNLAMGDIDAQLAAMGLGELIGLFIESAILSLAMNAIAICIFIIIQGRMLEIYLTISVAPIPLSTMVNREWGGMGNNYLKTLFALAFQGFLIMVCVAIYAVLLGTIPSAGNIHGAIWVCAAYTVLLCFTLFKTGSLSKSLFTAH